MEKYIPIYDLPVDYVIGEGFEENLLNRYKNFPCNVKSGYFILCLEGKMQISINANTYNIGKYDLMTLPPNFFMEILDFSSDIRIYYAGFSSKFIDSINLMKSTEHLLPVIMDNPVVKLPEKDAYSYILFYQSSIFAYASLRSKANKEITKAVFTMFLQGATEIYKMKKDWSSPSHTRKYEVYQDFMRLLMKHYTIEHGVSFYASKLGLSLPHFCSTIKQATGSTPLEVISSVILMEARSQLKSTDAPVKNIALALGFSNLSFFNKFFKQHLGVTPQEYRES